MLSALGLFSVAPGTPDYVLGSPIFRHVRIARPKVAATTTSSSVSSLISSHRLVVGAAAVGGHVGAATGMPVPQSTGQTTGTPGAQFGGQAGGQAGGQVASAGGESSLHREEFLDIVALGTRQGVERVAEVILGDK